MPELTSPPWPHAPTHQLTSAGTYFVTAATYQKEHLFRKREQLDALQQELLTVMQEFNWTLEAWAVFSNHYHFIAHSPTGAEDAGSLSRLLTQLHRRTAIWLNQREGTENKKVWHNFWDTKLSYQRSYLARLNYVHQNPVRHGLSQVASLYPWCSARWLERVASPAIVQAIYRFKSDKLRVQDDFAPIVEH